MKRMTNKSNRYPDDGRYRIVDCGGYYRICIASDRAGMFITYEYDASCGTCKEVEEELRKYDFHAIVRRYREQCVYRECVEAL